MVPPEDRDPVADKSSKGDRAAGAEAATATTDEPAERKQWYVLKVQSNRERSIRDSLLKRIKLEGVEEYFGEIVIPTEKVAETKGGKKRVVSRKLFPGYMMIHMELNDETWYLVRDTSGVGDFTGAAGKPIAMQPHEIDAMLGKKEEAAERDEPVVRISVRPGDNVKITEGPFESFEGEIETIDEKSGKIQVAVQILGQRRPVEIEYWQVEPI